MAGYYDANPPTAANAKPLLPNSDAKQHFPSEGLYLGNLSGGNVEIPALYDLRESNGLCFLYNNEAARRRVNTCLENLVWRIALTVPSNLCELVLFNGGNAGDAFSIHARINSYLFDDRIDRIFFDGTADAFLGKLNDIYISIVERISTIQFAGKQDLVELNESLGRDARLKYEFIVLTDFPRHLRPDCVQRLAQIVDSGRRAGVYVLMSWDMNADFDDASHSGIDPRKLLSSMELLFPQGERYEFRGSGHDDAFNRFNYEMDDTSADIFVLEKCIQYINIQAETAKKESKPSALKQDFDALEKSPYEPVMSEISVTVGLDVHDKHPITVRFNSGDFIHAFILGQSGSGKSVLLNNIITSAILKYSPEDLMLYLLDFKGVEFNRYKGVKHTKAVLVDNSDSQMTLEVLRELKNENEHRIKLWDKEKVTNIDEYNKKYPDRRVPQILFVADECQVMFKTNISNDSDRLIQQEIQRILNDIAPIGRSQGIHMLLATQQLDEADISGQILKNLTECFLLMSSPADSDKLVDGSSDLTSRQMTGIACYYHKLSLQSQVQTFFATNEELASAIQSAQLKATAIPGNGEYYFCGSSQFYLNQDWGIIENNEGNCPISIIGKIIGINSGVVTMPLRDDFSENILIFGANRKEQSAGVAMNCLISLIASYNQKGVSCNFLVIDCLIQQNSRYKKVLEDLAGRDLCRLIPRQESGCVLHDLVDNLSQNKAQPTVLVIIGQERFIEMKRDLSLKGLSSSDDKWTGNDSFDFGALNSIQEIDVDENAVIPELTAEQKQLLQTMSDQDEQYDEQPEKEVSESGLADKMTYLKALSYILDEGPIQGVHTLLLVDKPGHILFEDDYGINDTDKFRHKIILHSENKYLQPMRFSQDIDVERLSDDLEHLRAYYYPDGDDPVLFSPYLMPDPDIITDND